MNLFQTGDFTLHSGVRFITTQEVKMKKTPYVADGMAIVNVQGLRTVRKIETNYPSEGTKYTLHLHYRGEVLEVRYGKDKEAWDGMYEKLTMAMLQYNE